MSAWWNQVQQSDVHPITLRIRDKVLREEFEEQQLMLVKKRWNILTVVFLLSALLVCLTSINDSKAILGFTFITGDCVVVGIVMSLLGMKWKKVHNYSLALLIFVHGVFSCIQTYYLVNESSIFTEYIDLISTN